MEYLAILKAISEGVALVDSIRGQIEAARDTMTSENAAEVKEALAGLQAKVDDLHPVVQSKLRGTPAA